MVINIPEKIDHYFSKNPSSEYKEYKIHAILRNREFNFFTAKGVFSPKNVDLGTKILCKKMEIPENDKGGLILDMGCGYGVVGIVASTINPNLTIHFIDINTRSAELSKKNAKLNKIRKYKVFIGDYLNVMQKNGAYYDRILFNPPIKVGQDTYIDHIIYALKFLKENGSIFIVIKKKLGAESVNRKLESKIGEMENFDNIELKIIAKNSGYWITKISKIM